MHSALQQTTESCSPFCLNTMVSIPFLFLPPIFALVPSVTHGIWGHIASQNYLYGQNKTKISECKQLGTHRLVRWMELPLTMLGSHTSVLLTPVSITLLPIRLPANGPRRGASDGPNTWTFANYWGDQDGIVGFCLHPGRDLTVVATWGVSQQMKSFYLSAFLSLVIILPFKQIISLKKKNRKRNRLPTLVYEVKRKVQVIMILSLNRVYTSLIWEDLAMGLGFHMNILHSGKQGLRTLRSLNFQQWMWKIKGWLGTPHETQNTEAEDNTGFRVKWRALEFHPLHFPKTDHTHCCYHWAKYDFRAHLKCFATSGINSLPLALPGDCWVLFVLRQCWFNF